MSPQVVVPVAGYGSDELDAAATIRVARDAGLDVSRPLFLSFIVDFGPRREDACAAARTVSETEWNSALYGDATGWVLRLGRTRQLTREAVEADLADVHEVAVRHSGHLRGAAIEDLRPDDVWVELATQLHESGRRADDSGDSGDSAAGVAAVPSQREPRANRSAR